MPESGFTDETDRLRITPESLSVGRLSGLDAYPVVSNFSFSATGMRPIPAGAWLLHASLFIATFLTTTAFGSALVETFDRGWPLTLDALVNGYSRLMRLDRSMWAGLYFSVPLLAILLAHEMGHYLQCRKRGVDASLPYFLPSPLTLGTFGAFIRIRSPIYSRAGLFDIAVSGPIAGFAILTPFLALGLALSKTASIIAPADSITFGTPLGLRIVELFYFGSTQPAHILLHPIAMAAWAGLFATALNLLPIGQLDGGHILYAVGLDRWHRRISLATVAILAIAGFFYWPWWCWGAAMFFFGRRHPLVYDSTPLGRKRLLLCLIAFAILLLSVIVVPVRSI